MKNLQMFFISFLAIFIGSALSSSALQPIILDEATNNQEIEQQIYKTPEIKIVENVLKTNVLAERYTNNFRECEPLHFKQSTDFFGLKFNLSFDINGWSNDKCSYYFKANVEGLGKDIKEVYNITIPDEKITQIEPQIQCDFSREQLNTLVDAIITISNDQSFSEELLEAPEKRLFNGQNKELTQAEEQILKLIIDDKACTITNFDTLIMQFNELLKPQSTNDFAD